MLKKLKKTAVFLFFTTLIVFAFQFQQVGAEKPALTLRTDKTTYFLGENVTIILTNVGDENIAMGGYPTWQIFSMPNDEPVFPAVFAFLAWDLNQGESDIFVWNQYNEFNWTFVKPGTYFVRDTQEWGLSASFEIVALNDTIPEFHLAGILPLLMALSMFVVVMAKKCCRKS